MTPTKPDPRHLAALRRYYDIPTLRRWIEQYERTTGQQQVDQVARWRRILKTLEDNGQID